MWRWYVCTPLRVYAVGGEETTAVPYIVCEYMALGDLATLLRNSDPVVFRSARNPDVPVIRQVPCVFLDVQCTF